MGGMDDDGSTTSSTITAEDVAQTQRELDFLRAALTDVTNEPTIDRFLYQEHDRNARRAELSSFDSLVERSLKAMDAVGKADAFQIRTDNSDEAALAVAGNLSRLSAEYLWRELYSRGRDNPPLLASWALGFEAVAEFDFEILLRMTGQAYLHHLWTNQQGIETFIDPIEASLHPAKFRARFVNGVVSGRAESRKENMLSVGKAARKSIDNAHDALERWSRRIVAYSSAAQGVRDSGRIVQFVEVLAKRYDVPLDGGREVIDSSLIEANARFHIDVARQLPEALAHSFGPPSEGDLSAQFSELVHLASPPA